MPQGQVKTRQPNCAKGGGATLVLPSFVVEDYLDNLALEMALVTLF